MLLCLSHITLFRLNSQTAFARLCHACAFPVCLCCQTGTPRCIPGPLESSQSHFAKQQHFPTARVATTPNCKQHQISSICDFYLFSWDLWWTHTFNWLSMFKMEPVFNGCGRGTHTNESRTPTRTHIYTHTRELIKTMWNWREALNGCKPPLPDAAET